MTVEPSVTTPSDTQTKHRIVIIGSGFGGLFAARALKRRKDVDVTLIARTTHHLFQPLLYQVATGVLSEGEIAPATREVLSHQKNARVLLGEVTHIGLDTRTVAHEVMGRQTVTPYDSLIVAAGAGQSYFGNDQFSDHAPGMKTIDDALELRGRIFGAFELAELAPTEEERRRLLTFVVVGAASMASVGDEALADPSLACETCSEIADRKPYPGSDALHGVCAEVEETLETHAEAVPHPSSRLARSFLTPFTP